MLELLDLADRVPDLAALSPFLADPDPQVRRAAVATLTEVVPQGAGPALATALLDEQESVRSAAAAALRELVEVLPGDDELRAALLTALTAPDPVSRAAVLDVLRALKLGGHDLFREAARDEDHRVRLQAVRGLVSLDDVAGVAAAGADAEREVRVAAAHGLGTIASPEGAEHLVGLAGDPEPLVRAAALEASAGLAGVEELWRQAVAGAEAPEWQVRVGAVRGLVAAPADVAAPVRRPVRGRRTRRCAQGGGDRARPLGASAPDVRDALELATKDIDADVRGYARRALAGPSLDPSPGRWSAPFTGPGASPASSSACNYARERGDCRTRRPARSAPSTQGCADRRAAQHLCDEPLLDGALLGADRARMPAGVVGPTRVWACWTARGPAGCSRSGRAPGSRLRVEGGRERILQLPDGDGAVRVRSPSLSARGRPRPPRPQGRRTWRTTTASNAWSRTEAAPGSRGSRCAR